jgi:hypothetical protein
MFLLSIRQLPDAIRCSTGSVSWCGSTLVRPYSAKIGGPVNLTRASANAEVGFDKAEINGNLDCQGATFGGPLPGISMRVTGNLVLTNLAANGRIAILRPTIGGNLECWHNKIQGGPTWLRCMRKRVFSFRAILRWGKVTTLHHWMEGWKRRARQASMRWCALSEPRNRTKRSGSGGERTIGQWARRGTP